MVLGMRIPGDRSKMGIKDENGERQLMAKIYGQTLGPAAPPRDPPRKGQLLLSHIYFIPELTSLLQDITTNCLSWQQTNAKLTKKQDKVKERGIAPGRFWEINFTKVRPGRSDFKYLLVMVDIVSGWTEAFPTKKETAQIVTKNL